MSTGGASSGTAGILDFGTLGSPADNTFTRTDGVAGGIQPYWPAWWTFTLDTDGYLILDTSDTEGTGLVDTMLNIRRDDPTNAPFAGDDDSGGGPAGRASHLAVDVYAGFTYWVKVGAFDADGSGIDVYHLAASLIPIPTLPNPRTFILPGGALTDPGLVMGPGVVDAPQMSPLSISRPAVGLPDATFVFDATTWLDTLGVSSAWITFDSTLSYRDDGTCDTYTPEVGLNVFTVPHALPFTWEEDWDTLEVGNNGGTDDYGRLVPRGQQGVLVHTGTTYIIQLTTPPSLPSTLHPVRFILRVSDFGAHTTETSIPDQTWRVTNDPYDSGAGDPVAYGPETIPWAKNNAGTFGAVDVDAQFPAWTLAQAFHGTHTLRKGTSGPLPGGDLDAVKCSWVHARRGKAAFDWWTSNLLVAGAGDPVCRSLSDHESSQTVSDGRVGYTYQSQTDAFGSTAGFDVYDNQFRIKVADLLERFDAFAGASPFFDAPDGYTNTSPVFSGPTGDPPELLAVEIAMDQLDSGTHAANGTRMYVDAVPYDDSGTGLWGPAGDSSTTDEWRGTTDGPEQYDGSHPVQFASSGLTNVPLDTVWGAALEDEADADDSGGPSYLGGLRVVGLFPAQFIDDLPDPTPTATNGESISDLSTFQFPVLFLKLRATVTYRFADYSTVPVATLLSVIPPLRQFPRDDGLATSSAARLYPPPRSQQGSNRRAGGYF